VGLGEGHAPPVRRRDWLAEEPFTLNLGAGFFGFFSHTGVLAELEAAGLRPQRVIGVSAGALAGGLWSSGLSAATIEQELCALRRADFWDPGLPVGGLLRGRKFERKLREVLASTGIQRLEECPTPFTAIVHDVLARKTRPVDRGSIHVAIRASCTVPLMFRPLVDRGRILVDGGVSDRSGFSALRQGERVLLHYIPSRRRLRLRPPSPPPVEIPGCRGLTLVTPDLPAVSPFRLDAGPVALRRTREHTRQWLDETVP
jgi:NTE family protein